MKKGNAGSFKYKILPILGGIALIFSCCKKGEKEDMNAAINAKAKDVRKAVAGSKKGIEPYFDGTFNQIAASIGAPQTLGDSCIVFLGTATKTGLIEKVELDAAYEGVAVPNATWFATLKKTAKEYRDMGGR